MKPNIWCGSAALVLTLALLPAAGAAQEKSDTAEKPAAHEKAAAPEISDRQRRSGKPEKAKPESVHPFAAMAGSWSGSGTISLSSGTRERLRCRANYTVGDGSRSLTLSIRCASDSYRFDLSSNVVDRRGRVFGRWSETSNGVSGTISGSAVGGRVQAVASGDTFSAGLSLTTQGNRQSVSITPKGVHITGVHLALHRR